MAERIADLRRALHEVLDVVERRDATIERLRADLEASGRRLSAEIARRRAADERAVGLEARVGELEGELARSVPRYPPGGGRAGVRELLRRAAEDLVGAATLVTQALWHRVPEPVRGAVWRARTAVGRGRPLEGRPQEG